MTSKSGSKVNLTKYLPHNGKWQFFPVVKVNGRPKPELVLIHGKPERSKTGTYYLGWRENGVRKTRPVGSTPRAALDAWQLQCGILSGEADSPEEFITSDSPTTIKTAVEHYLVEVKATKSEASLRAYLHDLNWFLAHCRKHYVHQLGRDDAMKLFAAGRDEGLNQKTTNKRVIVMLQAMRSAGATIELKKGDWPKTTDKQVEVYEREELTRFLAACTPVERLRFQTFLCSGFRAQEVASCWTYWL